MTDPKCKDLVQAAADERINDLRTLFDLYQKGDEEGDPDLGTFYEYGLCFDFVPAHTFKDQRQGFFRYQISYGGPSEEFRFMTEDPNNPEPNIDFWYLDWFDGAKVRLKNEDRDLLLEIWQFFQEIGSTQSEFDKAQE